MTPGDGRVIREHPVGLGELPFTRKQRVAFARTHQLDHFESEFINRYLNPNTEDRCADDYSIPPDGALENSACPQLRQVDTITYPFHEPSSVLDLSGQTWNLFILQVPWFRTAYVMIASINTTTFSSALLLDFARTWNSTPSASQPIFPEWGHFRDNDELIYSVQRWRVFDGQVLPDASGSTICSQFRMCNQGLTMYHNAPTLVNQGMVYGAQFNFDYQVRPTARGEDTDGVLHVQGYVRVLRNAGNVFVLSASIPNAGVAATTVDIPADGTAAPNVTLVAGSAMQIYTPPTSATSTGRLDVVQGETITVTVSITRNGTSTVTMQYTIGVTAGTTTSTQSSGELYQNSWRDTAIHLDIDVADIGELGASNAVVAQIPPLDSERMVQASTKTVMYYLPESKGCYMPLKKWQPIWNVQEANAAGNILWTYPQLDTRADASTGGLVDTPDMNFGVGVIAINGIAAATSPTLKVTREVELVPAEGSLWRANVHDRQLLSERAIKIADAIAQRQPWMYPEPYNSAGILGTIINGVTKVVNHVPLIGDVLGVVRDIFLPKAQGAQTSANPGAALADVIEKVLAALKQ